ncbi:Amidohydrolase family protein [Abditibacterium utsteinense]|uniref:Amidohydrolase family protein n=1 Tax=Abditibacterium utsteinense TaxID=1960156 RepID=A0A2S8SPE5_9BACT|nr:Amidohydrolase family protein [Abditibacterium utsteinense]
MKTETTAIADLIVHNGKISTLDPSHPEASSMAIKDGQIIGLDDAEFARGPQTRVIDLKGRRVIPGLNDSHLHLIRGGLNYNLELRWDGVPSLADALRMLREQVARTPAPQ